MSRGVLFTPAAREQFLAALAYIAADDPVAARSLRDRAAASLSRLADYPESGRVLPEFPELPFREVVVPPYRFFYRVKDDAVWVVAAWHSAQLPGDAGYARDSAALFIQMRERRDMIARVWHGWTSPANADAYEALLKEEIFVGIQDRRIRGFKDIRLLRRAAGDEVEFVTLMWFESLDAVREFAGEDSEASVVPAAARALLAHFDERSQHYEVRA